MIISIDNENIACNTYEEFKICINSILNLDSSEIWISENGEPDELPCLGILLNHNDVVINYFSENGDNFVTVGNNLDEGYVLFCNGQYEVAKYQIVDKNRSIRAILDFFDSKKMSDDLQWEEL